MSLVNLCAAFIRKNYENMEISAPFSALIAGTASLQTHLITAQNVSLCRFAEPRLILEETK